MKRIIIYIFLLWSLSGCNDALDLLPENSLTFRNAFQTEKDIESGLAAADALIRQNIALPNMVTPTARGVYADYVDPSHEKSRMLQEGWIPDLGWHHHYTALAQVNTVAHYLDQADLSPDRKRWCQGKVCFYRAFIYLDLIRRWGDCVLVKDEIVVEPRAKSRWTEVAGYAIEMAEKAVELLPELTDATDSEGDALVAKSTPCKGAANALLAHLSAWKAGCKYMAIPEERNYDEKKLWEIAEKACTDIIESGVYGLESTPEEVCAKTMVGESKESIYETTFRNYWNEMINYDGGYFCYGGLFANYPVKPGYTPGRADWAYMNIYASSVYQLYPGNDQRKYAYFYKLDSLSHDTLQNITKGYAYTYKWRPVVLYTTGSSAGNYRTLDCNRIWWRLADIYLLRAECRFHLNDNAGAIKDLDFIRNRARATAYSASEYSGDLQYAIFKERERELLLEGFRYYDIIRNNYVRTELLGRHRQLSDQDIIDGAMFISVPVGAFSKNPLMRQHVYWSKYM